MDNMKEELRETYSAMETDDLLRLRAKGTLTDTASAVLQEVLDSRGLDSTDIAAAEASYRQEVLVEKTARSELATIASRFCAKLIDVVVASVVFVVLSDVGGTILPAHREAFSALLVIPFLLYLLLKDSIGGQSIGKRIVRIKVIRTDTGRACTWFPSFFRNLSTVLGIIDGVFAFGEKRQRLGDMIAGTQVIRASRNR